MPAHLHDSFDQFDSKEPSGEQLRDAAHKLLCEHRAEAIKLLKRAALELALERDSFTADDIRFRVEIPDDVNPVVAGAAVKQLADAKLLNKLGYVSSRRPEARARPVAEWSLRDRPAAEQLLAALTPKGV